MAPMAILVYRWSFSSQQVGWIIKSINQSMTPPLEMLQWFPAAIKSKPNLSHQGLPRDVT